MSRSLRVSYGVLPPSDNHIRDIQYRFIAGKRKAIIGYTREAEDFKKGLLRHINEAYFFEVQKFARAHTPCAAYLLSTALHFPPGELLNSGWLKVRRNGEREAKNPYKRLDTMNRRKLLEDCLAEALGIDDSLFWEGDNVKLVSVAGSPLVELTLEEVDPRRYGVPEEYLRGADG